MKWSQQLSDIRIDLTYFKFDSASQILTFESISSETSLLIKAAIAIFKTKKAMCEKQYNISLVKMLTT